MPPAPFCLPGPHDPHNEGSVKLAEATRIRLTLPGLNLSASSGSSKPDTSSNTRQTGKAAGEAAAAAAKAQKKLQKLQGIASQAEQAHAGIIVDDEVLQDSRDEGDERSSGPESSSKAATRGGAGASGSEVDRQKGPAAAASSSAVQGSSSQEAAAHSIRQPRQRSLAAAPKPSSSSSRAMGGEGICQGNRLVANSSNLSASDPISAGSGPPSCSSSASSSRRGSGDKPHVPIWERSLPSGPAEARKAAAAAAGPKLLQAVALKTFSPTLGSMGALSLNQDASQQDGSAPSSSSRPQGVLRSRSAAKAPAPAPPAAGLRKHTTPPHGKLSVAAAAAGAAAAPPLGIELPSALRHVSFSSGASAYTPSQLLEKLILR